MMPEATAMAAGGQSPGLTADLRRRDDLSVVRTVFRGVPRYVVSDRNTGRHLALSPKAYALLARLDGVTLVADCLTKLKIAPAEGERLVKRLLVAGLVTSSAIEPVRTISPAGPVEGRYLFMRRELVELGSVLPMLDRAMGWVFRPLGVVIWSVMLVASLLVFAADDGRADILAWLRQFDASQALLLYVLFLALKLLHELGHAVALWRMAGQEGLPLQSVRAGIAVMFFLPFPFTNVSAAWGLQSKWRRAAIGLAGMYVESWIAIIAVLVWALVDDPLVRAAAIQIATVSAFTTVLFNLNPFGRMDGYYVLGDLLERPNLMQRAQSAAMMVPARLFRIRPAADLPPLEPGLIGYWIGMLTYRILVFAGLVWLAHGIAPWLALVALAISVSLLVVRPALGTARTMQSMAVDPIVTRRRLIGFAVAVLGFGLLVPLPAGVSTVGVVEAGGARFIFPPRDVRVVSVSPAGTSGALMTLDSPDIVRAQAEAAIRQAEALARWRQAMDQGDSGAQAAAEAAGGQQAATDALTAEAALLSVAAAPGWDPLDAQDFTGAWVAPNSQRPLAVIIPPGRRRLHIMIDESTIADVRAGNGIARARIAGEPQLAFSARIARIASEAQHQLASEALGKPAGGPITINPDDRSGRRSVNPMTSVWLVPGPDAPTLRHGQRVEVRLGSPPRPLFWQTATTATRLLDRTQQR